MGVRRLLARRGGSIEAGGLLEGNDGLARGNGGTRPALFVWFGIVLLLPLTQCETDGG